MAYGAMRKYCDVRVEYVHWQPTNYGRELEIESPWGGLTLLRDPSAIIYVFPWVYWSHVLAWLVYIYFCS